MLRDVVNLRHELRALLFNFCLFLCSALFDFPQGFDSNCQIFPQLHGLRIRIRARGFNVGLCTFKRTLGVLNFSFELFHGFFCRSELNLEWFFFRFERFQHDKLRLKILVTNLFFGECVVHALKHHRFIVCGVEIVLKRSKFGLRFGEILCQLGVFLARRT